ncbi:hypothetical protein ACUHMQ_09075 [Chitinimonas sp. PSY-7]|uniref:hypothetical protein n=1 Tax=Chitinimonas sp. PSY-7 TaxID=3459088 RepID=UPI0040400196
MGNKPCVLTIVGAVQDIIVMSKPANQDFNKYEVRTKILEGDNTLIIDTFGVFENEGNTLVIDE